MAGSEQDAFVEVLGRIVDATAKDCGVKLSAAERLRCILSFYGEIIVRKSGESAGPTNPLHMVDWSAIKT